MTVGVVIVAAGKGLRLGAPVPKQYLPIAGKPLIEHTIDRFLGHQNIDFIQLVIDPDERERYGAYRSREKMLEPVGGGSSRQQSVRFGLEALKSHAPDHVLIHDGARPLLSSTLIDRLIGALDRHGAVLPVLKVADTLKQVEGNRVCGDQNRDLLVRAQTPQAFHFDLILDAHIRTNGASFTDDAGIATHLGHDVHIIEGEESNYKITHSADFRRAERDLGQQRRWRSAQGYDVHRLVEGRPLVLGGIQIPFEKGLDGHSDADVALHALTDAILGLTANGDIGSHFPPSDPKWKNASSDRFLIHSVELLRAAGGELDHADLTIVCEHPKIGPHREAMQARIAELVGLDPTEVSIKATTNERLGFLGRGEGIAALATASASLPWKRP
jgi:2-C-methyl-D-erythritol 4-phosphate cytidylyltransferase/2-C-methyl-D-erythritol 2,4-cyclodiphosphate synthase